MFLPAFYDLVKPYGIEVNCGKFHRDTFPLQEGEKKKS